MAGGCAGVTLWTLIFPADVVKSRLQVSGSSTPMLVMMSQIYRYVAIRNQGYLTGIKKPAKKVEAGYDLSLITFNLKF